MQKSCANLPYDGITQQVQWVMDGLIQISADVRRHPNIHLFSVRFEDMIAQIYVLRKGYMTKNLRRYRKVCTGAF